ncbi:MAG: cytochrome ubiquinol oxidase subunit I [Candidatus Krumholzibacteriota bacterium]
MNYPVWELGMGAGVLIAVVSILHVFVSHFAVGGGLWLVVTEMRARRTGDDRLRNFVKSHSRFFMLLTLVFGAITGVGIWATIGLISPHGTSALIHGYVWGWAIEWVFFFVEIAAALVYYYGWERLDARTHEAVGWIYFAAAYMSLVIINGIITFMLTPGGWLENREFWTGFFNPTYWPSLLIRTFGALAIAGLFTLLTSTRVEGGGFRWRLTRWNAAWALVAMAGVVLSAMWYGSAVGVWRENEALLGAIPVLPKVAGLFRIGLIATTAWLLVPLAVPKLNRGPLATGLLVLALLTMGAGEWLRESGRKPFTIHGYLYSTGMLVEQEDWYAENGMAAGTKWLSEETREDPLRMGRELYLAWCQPCHTENGYNGLRPFLALWNEETVASLVPRLEHMRALMPPWYGTEEENSALTAYLMSRKPREKTGPGAPVLTPERAFAVSCGLCHTPRGYRSLAESMAGMTPAEIDEFLDEAGDLMDEMPAYHGPTEQRTLLIDYLHELGNPPTEADAAERSAS